MGVDAGVGEAVNGAETGQKHRDAQIPDVGEVEPHEPKPHAAVDEAVADIAAYQKRLAGQPIHQRRHEERDKNIGNKLDGHDQRGGQRTARLVKDQKGQGKAPGDAACRAQRRGDRDQCKAARPKLYCLFFHCFITSGHIIPRGFRKKKPGTFGKALPQMCR